MKRTMPDNWGFYNRLDVTAIRKSKTVDPGLKFSEIGRAHV